MGQSVQAAGSFNGLSEWERTCAWAGWAAQHQEDQAHSSPLQLYLLIIAVRIINDLHSSERFLRHYVIEVLAGDLAAVAGCALQHLLQLLDVHGLAEFLGHPADVVGVDGAGVVVIEEIEDLVDSVLSRSKAYPGFLVSQTGSDAVQELLEVHLPAEALEVGDHVEDGGVLALESEALHGALQLSRIDLARGLRVEEVEGLAQLLDLVLGESRTLDFLLGWALGSWLWSGCHFNKSQQIISMSSLQFKNKK